MVPWRGSLVGEVIIFCCTHMLAPTSSGRIKEKGTPSAWDGSPRLRPRKLSFSGTIRWTSGQEYRRSERLNRRSGEAGSTWRIARYRAIQMGNCTAMGRMQPMGLTPASL